jgi:hypothetical protein
MTRGATETFLSRAHSISIAREGNRLASQAEPVVCTIRANIPRFDGRAPL